jgi:hypothetical protein
MNRAGYLFAAGVTVTRMLPTAGGNTLQSWDTCMTAIVYGSEVDRAQQTFERWCQATREGEEQTETEIKKIVGAQLIDQLLTEAGAQPLDWGEIVLRQTVTSSAEADPEVEVEAEAPIIPDERGEGYWVDANQVVPPKSARLDLESLQHGLPEDIGSGLNWSPNIKFLFLVSSLSAPRIATENDEFAEEPDSNEAEEQEGGQSRPVLEEAIAGLPEMREKETAALIEARNAVVAAWIWRKFAETTRLASNEILVSPCCAIFPESS